MALNGSNKTSSSIVYKTFRGRMRQHSKKILPAEVSEEAGRTLQETDEFKGLLTVDFLLSLIYLI